MSLLPLVKKLGWLAHQKPFLEKPPKPSGGSAKNLRGQGGKSLPRPGARVLVVGPSGKARPGKTRAEKTGALIPASLLKSAPLRARAQIKKGQPMVHWTDGSGDIWLLQMQNLQEESQYGLFAPSPYGMARDLMGTCFRHLLSHSVTNCVVESVGLDEEAFKGLCVGLEMAQYRFQNQWPKTEKKTMTLELKTSLQRKKELFREACLMGEAVNLARFLVDLPPNELQPQSYAKLLKALFSPMEKTRVEVWGDQRLQKEKMGLHQAVGQASPTGSCLVRLEYRGGKKNQPLVAFVGKGITFDTGGLDLKPSSAMRSMKKDMGGSAVVAALASWAIQSKLPFNGDFYFPMAENSVGQRAFRPGDILKARNGLTVEVHNTDAEGRLVMADALSLAGETKPEWIIDVATLTGAIKQGLGSKVPGLFSNHDDLAQALLQAGQKQGDGSWRMPLIPSERARLHSPVADLVNCTDGFGGAVTAALFLEHFVDKIPWAHFDIYSWVESAQGPHGAVGGSGQVVQALAGFLQTHVQGRKP